MHLPHMADIKQSRQCGGCCSALSSRPSDIAQASHSPQRAPFWPPIQHADRKAVVLLQIVHRFSPFAVTIGIAPTINRHLEQPQDATCTGDAPSVLSPEIVIPSAGAFRTTLQSVVQPSRSMLPESFRGGCSFGISYLDVVVQGFAHEFGEGGVQRFFDTTDGWDTPVINDRPRAALPPRTNSFKVRNSTC